MLILVAIALLIVIGVFLIYVANKPAEFLIRRSQSMAATADSIYPLINDLHRFNTWNPFAVGDPALQTVYSGADSGPGAVYDWNSTGKSGAGRMAIVESSAPTRVIMQLDFTRPFKAHNRVEFTLTPNGSSTQVTWAMSGRNGYLQNLMGTLLNMDRMVGGEFAKGLSSLKALVEH